MTGDSREHPWGREIWRMLTPKQRRAALALLGLMLIGALLEMLGVGLILPLIALFSHNDPAQHFPWVAPLMHSLGEPSRATLIIGAMLLLLCIYCIKALFLALLIRQQGRFSFAVQAHISERLFSIYLQQPYTFHLQHHSARLMRNINETSTFREGLMALIIWCTEALVLLILGGFILMIEPGLTLAVAGLFGIVGACYHYLLRRRITAWGQARQHHEGLRMQHMQQGLGGVKAIKLGGHEADFIAAYQRHTVMSVAMAKRQFILQQLPRLGLELLTITSLSLMVIVMLLQGRSAAEVLPVTGLFAAIALRAMPSVNRLIATANGFRYSLPVIEKIYAELGRRAAPTCTAEQTRGGDIFSTALEVEGVSYTYPGAAAPALQGISLLIRPGEAVGICGESGAGKSTLLDVLLGLLSPDAGTINIDGRDMHTVLREWQRQIGYVPQSIFLTDDSLRRNIAFGLPDKDIDEDALIYALRAARLDRFIATLPEGVQTPVGEHGIRLSGGQRQRIGIARALYYKPAVLVLDEATNALDMTTEREVMQAVIALQGKKTTIIVAHRPSAIEHCDQHYRLQAGGLVKEDRPLRAPLHA